MSDIEELNGRILAAMDRVAKGVDALAKNDSGEVEGLQQALAEEKQVNAQLTERVRVLAERQDQAIAALETKAEEATSRVAALDEELQKLKKANGLLSEACGALREANAEGVGDASLINKAMEAELDAIRAMRRAEVLEADQILSALTPLLAASATSQDTEEAH
ncbi:hypothetical protein CEP88_04665 [Roseobacter denitrificans]|nr:hypothetical protein [Roseobacter denitrificans]AVL51958.1 hypothetical protein CEP88_04665 [Roseobacter denitrificans]SFF82679.1 hypothetical protein SAMN05443635_102468 [Roseobacter denitrificans OCh 114]